MDGGVPKERFHCIIFYLSFKLRTNTYKTEVLYIIFIFIIIIIIIIIIITIKITITITIIIMITSFSKV